GGNDYTLYEIDTNGKLMSTTPIEGTVRKIEAGRFLDKKKESLFVMTYSHDKFRWEFMGFLDPDSKKILGEAGKNDLSKDWGSLMVTDMSVADLDQDGKDDLLTFGSTKAGLAQFIAFNGELEEIAKFIGSHKHKQRYAHVYGQSLQPVRDEVAF
ncbi:hypothetical protein P4B35_24075, partial [Pontiellaceae bacterium B12227]|nr:hypothetical protein [Pontiellaceae bacterium B12227]